MLQWMPSTSTNGCQWHAGVGYITTVPSEAIYKADCVSFWRETLLQMRVISCYANDSPLMLSCLGFSLTWDKPSWYVRLGRTVLWFFFVQLNGIINWTADSSLIFIIRNVVVVIQISNCSHKDLNQLWTGSSIIRHNEVWIVGDLQFDEVALTFKFQPILMKRPMFVDSRTTQIKLLRLVISEWIQQTCQIKLTEGFLWFKEFWFEW